METKMRESFVRVMCDGCGKTQDCSLGSLKRERVAGETNPISDAHVPNGWLLVWAKVKNEWGGGYGTFIEPKSIVNDEFGTYFVCSRSCAAGLLDKLSSLLAGG